MTKKMLIQVLLVSGIMCATAGVYAAAAGEVGSSVSEVVSKSVVNKVPSLQAYARAGVCCAVRRPDLSIIRDHLSDELGDELAGGVRQELYGVEEFIRSTDGGVQMALFKAAKKNELTYIEPLIARGAKINYAIPSFSYDFAQMGTYAPKMTPLLVAALHKHSEMVAMLVHYGADIDSRNQSYMTPLMIAAITENQNAVAILLRCGADKEAALPAPSENVGMTALALAAERGHVAIVRQLLAAGSRIETGALENENFVSALICAAHNNHDEVVQVLLQAGADINAVNNAGNTALMNAAQFSNSGPVIRLLLASGADRTVTNHKGQTAANIAARKGNQDVLLLLQQEV